MYYSRLQYTHIKDLLSKHLRIKFNRNVFSIYITTNNKNYNYSKIKIRNSFNKLKRNV